MKPEVKKLIIANLPVPVVCLPVRQAGAGLPAGGRGGLVGKAAAPSRTAFRLAFAKRRPQLPPV